MLLWLMPHEKNVRCQCSKVDSSLLHVLDTLLGRFDPCGRVNGLFTLSACSLRSLLIYNAF
jgi:hypothetical protein